MDTPRSIVFIGPQGSGKGTQVELLETALFAEGVPVVRLQTGDVFRALSSDGSFAGTRLQACLEAGQLVPDAITNGLLIERLLQQLTESNVVLFDGYPRSRAQADALCTTLAFFGRPTIDVLHLDTPDAIVRERMEERGRADDTPKAINARLSLYHQETEPLLEHFRAAEQVQVHDIDGSASIEAVHQAIVEIFTPSQS